MLNNGKHAELRAIDKVNYNVHGNGLSGLISTLSLHQIDDLPFDLESIQEAKKMSIDDVARCYGCTSEEVVSFLQMKKAKSEQARRLKRHIDFMFNQADWNIYFITLTFSDSAMIMSQATRKRYVTDCLKKCTEDYIANIDYGEENEREHYHATIAIKNDIRLATHRAKIKKGHYITCCDNEEVQELFGWKYGWITMEPIKIDQKDRNKVANYMASLKQHALKVENVRIIAKKDSRYHEKVKKSL